MSIKRTYGPLIAAILTFSACGSDPTITEACRMACQFEWDCEGFRDDTIAFCYAGCEGAASCRNHEQVRDALLGCTQSCSGTNACTTQALARCEAP